ncbi:MAG: M48 family metallopeptidase, partial [Candidatus Obscuribacterales bacterium]|nr:M48 family metallopeptidase [Candidatus Obscuribacterales bacterium]
YTKESSEPVACQVTVTAGEIIVESEGATIKLPARELTMEIGGQMSDRIKLTHGDSSTVVLVNGCEILESIEQNLVGSELAKLASKAKHQVKHAPLMRGSHMATFFGSIALLLAIGYFTFDFWVNLTVDHIPPSAEERLGELVMPEGLLTAAKSKDANRLEKIGQKLVLQLNGVEYKFNFYVEDKDELNAYAMPGGKIVVLSKLLAEAKSDDEIAGVLAHEIGHVIHRDTLRRLVHTGGLGVCIAIISGGFISNDQIKAVLPAVHNLEQLSYSRGQEASADKTAVDLALKAGYQPEALIDLFQRLEKENAGLPKAAMMLISDHPMAADRVAAIRAEAKRIRAEMKVNEIHNK